MSELKDKFAKLVNAVESEAPELLPVLQAYKLDTWPTFERAEEIYAEIRDKAKAGTHIADTTDYSKWENEDCTFEHQNKNLSFDYVSVRGNTRVILSRSHCAYGLSTSYQSDGQVIWWSEEGTSIRAGYLTIANYPNMMQFKARIGSAHYTVNIYEDGAEVIRRTTLIFSQGD
jgi:hypothetical protein